VTIKIGKPNLKRLATLSALGAGALGVTAGAAEASTIVYSGILDEKVGFGRGWGTKATIAGPDGVAAIFGRGGFPTNCSVVCAGSRVVGLGGRNGSHGTEFLVPGHQGLFSVVSAFPQNAKFGTPARLFGGGVVAVTWCVGPSRPCNPTNASILGQYTKFSPTDRYILFEFTGGDLSEPLYGWAQLSVDMTSHGPDVTLINYAYDTSGAQIPAGDKGTPEPSTVALTGLAALALGAQGLRSWRAARKAA